MQSDSIVKRATATARRAAFIALLGAAAIVGCFFVERTYFQEQFTTANAKLLAAHRAAALILLADERLTMSANMAVATGERRWLVRHAANLPLIDLSIDEASALAPPAIAARFVAETGAASDRLVELETRAFEAVKQGDPTAARAILDGAAYQRHKDVLRFGTKRFVDAMIASISAEIVAVQQRAVVAIIVVLALSLAGAVALWRVLNTSLTRSETAMLEAEHRIKTLAMTDLLTGLANRVSLCDALNAAISRAARSGTRLAVIMFDLDRFKPVNDRHGHLIGDLVLKEVAKRMGVVLRRGEVRARYGGDEFVAVVEYGSNEQIPRTISRRLIEELSQPMCFGDTTVQIGASVGYAVYPNDAMDEEGLMRKADIALYRAKHEGRGSIRTFDSGMDRDIEERTQLETELRDAIAAGDVVPYFQPIVDLITGETRGFEVLARWSHPTRGPVPPADFIPIAELSGQIGALTVAVLTAACKAATALPEHLPITLNVAPQQVQSEWLAPEILAVLESTRFPPHRLEVEITERSLVTDLPAARRVIASLKNVGIKVALDDFGTGYSSLCQLSELGFDKIKIDGSFVRSLHERPSNAKLVQAMVGLGRNLGVPTVAEGVETEDEAAFLRQIGCPLAQGFLFCEPMPEAELAGFLGHRRRKFGRLAIV